MAKNTRKPLMGCAFDGDFMNDSGRVACYLGELRYYRPRGFSALHREGAKLLRDLESADCPPDAVDTMDSWIDSVEEMLTTWAQRITRNDYIHFGPSPDLGSVGFQYAVDSALDDCDIRLDAGDDVPRGFTGQAAFVTDHGNVAVRRYSRGRMVRELFDVV